MEIVYGHPQVLGQLLNRSHAGPAAAPKKQADEAGGGANLAGQGAVVGGLEGRCNFIHVAMVPESLPTVKIYY